MSFLHSLLEQENKRLEDEGSPPITPIELIQSTILLSVFENQDVSQVEADQLAVIALNFKNISLFKSCVDHGARLINHPNICSFPELSEQEQHYNESTFYIGSCIEAFLNNDGPYFESVIGTNQFSLFQKDDHGFSLLTSIHKAREKAIRRECFPVDSELKKDRLIRFLNSSLGETFYHRCSSDFSQALIYELSIPQGALESLSYECKESIEIQKSMGQNLAVLSAEFGEFKAKAKHCVLSMLRNHNHPDPFSSFLNPWGYGEPTGEHWTDKNKFLAHCLFSQADIPGLSKLLGEHKDTPCYEFPEYSQMLFKEQPRFYFLITALENCLHTFNRFSDEQRQQLKDDHPFWEHAENLILELFKKDCSSWLAPLVMSENGVWQLLVESPLFSSHHVLSAVIQWSDRNSSLQKDQEESCAAFMRIAEKGLKQRKDIDFQSLLSTDDPNEISNNLFLSMIQKIWLSKNIKPIPAEPQPTPAPSFRF